MPDQAQKTITRLHWKANFWMVLSICLFLLLIADHAENKRLFDGAMSVAKGFQETTDDGIKAARTWKSNSERWEKLYNDCSGAREQNR